MAGVLDGVRVLDFGRYIAGPMCSAILGDFGADVIRVERVSGGDDRYQYPVTPEGEGPCFMQMNRNKRGITLNPMKEEGRELVRKLVAQSDVVVANLPADTLKTMGLDYETLKAIKPDIILTHVSAFGEEGPYGNRVGFDGIGQAMCGSTYLSGYEGQPTKSYASFVDVTTALYSAIGTLAAIMEQKATGRGQEVKTTLFGSAVSVFNFNIIEQALVARDRVPSGNRAQSSGPSDIVATKDGWIIIQSVGRPIYERWVSLIGDPALLDDPRFTSDEDRAVNGEALSELSREWAKRYTNEEALDLLAKARVPAGPVYSPQQLLDDPHVKATNFFTPVDYPGAPKPFPLFMGATKLTETPTTLRMRPPTLGEHTDEVMASIGLSRQDIADLRAKRVI